MSQPATNLRGQSALVTGATGAVGPSLVHRLIGEGCKVRVLSRRPPAAGLLPDETEFIQGDITLAESIVPGAKDVDVVFHLASKLHINSPSEDLRAEYERVNIEGTRNVVQVAQDAGVRRVVYFSTISVYGPSAAGKAFDEDSVLNPQELYAETKAEAESVALAHTLAGSGKPLSVVLRLAAVYGPHMKGNYVRLVNSLKQGWFFPVGDGSNRRTLVYEGDVACAAILAAIHDGASGQVFNVTDGNIHTFRDILAAISVGLQRRAPSLYLPACPVRLAAGLAEAAFRCVGKRPFINRSLVDKLLEDMAVNSEKFQRELGFTPQTGLTLGWQRCIQELNRSEKNQTCSN